MPEFSYKAKDELGQTVEGVLAAEDEDALALALRERNQYLIHASPAKAKKPPLSWGGKIERKDLITFAMHLSTIFSVGVPIVQGLEDLEAQTDNGRFRRMIRRLREDIQGGATLSDALGRHPKAFPPFFASMVKVGEATGSVDTVLDELVSFLEWQDELSRNIKRVTTYPIMVLFAIGIVLVVLFSFALPRMIATLQDLDVPLPLITRIMMGISHFMQNDWYYLVLGLGGSIIGLKLMGKTAKGQFLLDAVKLRLPILGNLMVKIALSRFAHHFKLLYRAGTDFPQTLSILEEVVGNRVFAKVVRDARTQVMAGSSLFSSLQASRKFPPLVMRMIALGETSGELDEALDKVCQYYDKEVPATVNRVFAALEPLMILFIAMIVMAVALSIYIPLYTAVGSIGV